MTLFKRLPHLPLCLQKLRAFFVLFVFFPAEILSYIVRIFFQNKVIFAFLFCKITINMLHK